MREGVKKHAKKADKSSMIDLESERLRLREMSADDLPLGLPVYLSNPDFLQQQEGSEGEAGKYDLERWQRDWFIA